MSIQLQIVAALSLVVLIAQILLRRRYPAPLPPGPPADILLGHARVFPRVDPQLTFLEWGRKYGDVIHLNVVGNHVVVLNSQAAASDLLEKKSAIYSSRGRHAVFELTGWAKQPAFMPYGEHYMRYRRFHQQALSTQQSRVYQPIQLKQAHILLRNLLSTPQDLPMHLSRFAASTVLEIAYGSELSSTADWYIELADKVTVKLTEIGDTALLDLLPFLVHFPSWFPGLGCLYAARETREIVEEMEEKPFQEVRDRMIAGTAGVSLASNALEQLEREGCVTDEELELLKIATTSLTAAGTETTWSTIMNFIAMMMLFPEAQKKAHEEIDTVISQGRLPDFSDRENLPYLQSVVYETMRWHPPVPLGIPHYSTADDIYRGMFIPKGSTVIANATGIAYDETVYRDPSVFRPERFLPEHNEPSPTNFVYGFGRRICPGRHLADASVWIAAASILTAFEIRPVLDEAGKEMPLNIEWTTAITSHPKSLQCRFVTRGSKAVDLVN